MKIARRVENEELFRNVWLPCLSHCLYFAFIGFRVHFHKLVSHLGELWLISLNFIYRHMANSHSECVPATNPKKSQMFVVYFIFIEPILLRQMCLNFTSPHYFTKC